MCSREEIAEMARKLFEDYDTNNDHALSRPEVKVIFETLFAEIKKTEKFDERRLNRLFTVADINSDQKLSYR